MKWIRRRVRPGSAFYKGRGLRAGRTLRRCSAGGGRRRRRNRPSGRRGRGPVAPNRWPISSDCSAHTWHRKSCRSIAKRVRFLLNQSLFGVANHGRRQHATIIFGNKDQVTNWTLLIFVGVSFIKPRCCGVKSCHSNKEIIRSYLCNQKTRHVKFKWVIIFNLPQETF